jgi:divalent metal cation (Fe/Co/Zn/Cd) transporter
MTDPAGSSSRQRQVLQTARVMWVAFLCAACGFVALSYRVQPPHPEHVPAPYLSLAFAIVAAADAAILGAIRRSRLAKSQEQARQGDAAQAQVSWLSAQVLGLASALSIVLFGFVLRMIGARPAWTSIAFFAAGLLIMAAYRPRLPETR